jgi:hypothetical protein
VTRPVALPATRAEALELRDLLEANLQALRALHDEHRRMLELNLRTIDSPSELRRELRAITSPRAPWVKALSETRALLFVALRELIIGGHQAELSMHLPAQALAEPMPLSAPAAAEPMPLPHQALAEPMPLPRPAPAERAGR